MINIDELYIVNYCHNNCVPLKNIMRLSEAEAYKLAAEMSKNNKDITAFGRFADFENYYPARMKTDQILYERFVRLGGRPKYEHPLSFVLQGSEFLYDWFDKGIITKVSLSRIPDDIISFTYGDSMTSLNRNGDIELITKGMLIKLINEYNGTLEEFLHEIDEKYRYMEVQLWDDEYCM